MFSIIIPLYNKAAYIKKAIYSVLNQTYSDFELIIVNDGSTDNSFSQLSVISYQLSVDNLEQFRKIRVVDQPNQGVSTARNNGVKLANYDYIAFLDADDWWESTYLAEMKHLIEEYPEAYIYGSSYFKVLKGNLIPAKIGVEPDFERGLIDYCKVYSRSLYQPLWTGATIIKKSVFIEENGFNPKLKMGEDFDLWIRVVMKQPVALLNKPLAYYNQDVVLANRAIGDKLYEPQQHMLFSDYSAYESNTDFCYMFETLAVYGLLPYYLAGKNKKEVNSILGNIHWENHSFKYRLFYRILPKWLVKFWLKVKKSAYLLKMKLLPTNL